MTENVTLFEEAFGGALLKLQAQWDPDVQRVSALTADVKFVGESQVDVDLIFAGGFAFDLSADLIVGDTGARRLIDAEGLKDKARHEIERLDTLRRQLQQVLAEPIPIDPGGNVLGVSFDSVALRIAPSILDLPPQISDDTVILGISAKKNLNSIAIPGAALSGEICIDVDLAPEILQKLNNTLPGVMRFDVPELPSFDLNLPRFELPEFKLLDIDLNLDKWTSDWPSLLPLSLPRIPNIGLTANYQANSDNGLILSNDDGQLTLKRKNADDIGTLTVKHDGTGADVLRIVVKNVIVQDSDANIDVDVTGATSDIAIAPFEIPGLPLKIALEEHSLRFDADFASNPNTFKLTHKFEKVIIASHSDPLVFLNLKLWIEYSAKSDEPSDIHTKVTKLEAIEPYSLDLITDILGEIIDAVGDVIRLIGQIKLPKGSSSPSDSQLRKILDRVLDLISHALHWLGDQAAAIGKHIAGAAEAVGRLIRSLIERLAQSDAPDFSHLCIEVRLNPNHWWLEQIILTPAGEPQDADYSASFLGVDLNVTAKFRPALVLNFAGNDWYGLALMPKDISANAVLSTDLWLKSDTSPVRPVGTLPDENQSAVTPRMLQLTATAKNLADPGSTQVLVLAAIQDGKLKLLQTATTKGVEEINLPLLGGNNAPALSLGSTGPLEDADLEDFVNVEFAVSADLKDRLLALMPKSGGDGAGNSKLLQKIKITSFNSDLKPSERTAEIDFKLAIQLTEGFIPEADLSVAVSLDDLSAKITAGDRISIYSSKEQRYSPLGLDVRIAPDKDADPAKWELFALDLSRGGERFALGRDADATVSYRRVSTSGEGLTFRLQEFAASRSGFDLEASVKRDVPVTLGGVDVPFRFTSGDLSIAASQFRGASLAGSGQLPPALVGEANASIALQLGAGAGGSVEVQGATARLDKSGDPIRCASTQFELTLTELGFDFVNDGSYHFYFLLSGSAAFRPEGGLFDSGLLKNFKELEIKLDKAPLGGDPRVLMRSISFLIKVDPPKQTNFFDLFQFDLKGIGFYPAADKFGGDPAMSISGQVKFAEFGDKISPRFDFHKMWIAGPADDGVLPRVRFDGLGVGLKTGAIDVEATAIAVDDQMPDLYRPDVLPANVRAEGFLAKGRLDIKGWASMSAALGFLQLSRREGPSDPRHAFFMYGQLEKLTEPIDTPVGRIYLREAGFGFGYRYTLAGIAQAETATSPRELVRILDAVSKFQGSLNQFEAWEPTYDNNDLTLALRGMFSIGAHYPQPSYSSENERDIPNPLLFDIVAALRTDLTFLINLRGWVATNYNDWIKAPTAAPWKSNPTMRGYLYFSVPRKEFLARAISERGGHVGEHPKLPDPLVDAIQAVSFSSTLYIRPGLFHMEFGWPYELGFDLGKRNEQFWLSVRGGLINRIEDFSLLYGMAFKAEGGVQFGGRIGNDNFGASATATARFALEAKIIAYLSLQRFNDSMFYGLLRFDLTLGISVSVWISFKIFRKRIRLSVGFSLHLAVSIALEAVITPQALGGRANVSVGVRAFGRTLSVGIGLSFNDGVLNLARARVARFQTLGLGTDIPPASEDGRRSEVLPRPAPPVAEQIADGDDRLNNDIGTQPRPAQPVPDSGDEDFEGADLEVSHFWAMLFPIGADRYLLQLVPRDGTRSGDDTWLDLPENTFFASPGDATAHKLESASGLLAHLQPVDVGGLGETSDMVLNRDLQLGVVIDTEGEQDLTLRDLLSTLFLRRGGDDTPIFTEPRLRDFDWDGVDLPETQDASARTLGAFARSREHLVGQAKREAEIEESRSAVIAAIMDSAEQIAQAMTDSDTVPGRVAEIDARDFGLTFTVDQAGLDALFDKGQNGAPGLAKFEVEKSDAPGKPGQVHLFNPPERMFRVAQPRMRPDHVLTPEGIKLNWDLEPAWRASKNAYDDPEFHLRRYAIRRRIVGLKSGEEYAAFFECKPAAPIEITPGDQTNLCKTIRPPFQFVDDLRRQDATAESPARDIPEEVRAALLGLNDSPLHSDDLQVEYDIRPIDIAGTSDVGEPYTVQAAPRFHVPPVSPIEATMQLVYPAIPTLADSTHPDPVLEPESGVKAQPALRLMLRRPPNRDLNDPATRHLPEDPSPTEGDVFDLRVLQDQTVPSGGFGSDAVSEAHRRLGQEQIDALDGADVHNFRVLLKEQEEDDTFTVAIDPANDEDGETQHFGATLQTSAGVEIEAAQLTRVLHAQMPRIEDEKIAPEPGTNARLFLRRPHFLPEHGGLNGEWRSVTPNIVMFGRRPAPKTKPDEDVLKYPAIDTMVETFELPVAMEFRALEREDIGVRSGRLHSFRPTATARLSHLLPQHEDPEIGLRLVPDPDRRTATRVTWNVRARSLALADADGGAKTNRETADSLFRWVSGYELYQLDPDSFVGDATDPETVAEQAAELGDVRLLPASERGLAPDKFGDMSRLEFSFPSTAWRDDLQTLPMGVAATAETDAPTSVTPPWFSAAESTVHFPRPQVRRTLLPDFDEGLLAELFAEGRPDRVTLSISAWADKVPLENWHLSAPGRAAESQDNEIILVAGTDDGFEVDDLRDALRASIFKPNTVAADLKASDEIQRQVARDPDFLRFVTLSIAAERKQIDRKGALKQKFSETAHVSQTIDLLPQTHPVLADVLAQLPFWKTHSGLTYRRYSLVPDDTPPSDAESFLDYLDEVPPERDPHGFAALRALGLAAGFQLYDTDEGVFLRRADLYGHINKVFSEVLTLYGMTGPDAPVDKGLPFVDVLTRPWGTGRLFWFDGGQEAADGDDIELLCEDQTLAAVQIAIRPASDRLVPLSTEEQSAIADRPVRMAVLRPKDNALTEFIENLEVGSRWLETFEIRLESLPDGVLVDLVAPASGIEALPVHRMTADALSHAIGYTPVAHEKLAYLRLSSINKDVPSKLDEGKVSVVTFVAETDEATGEEVIKTEKIAFEIVESAFDPTDIGHMEAGMGQFSELLPDEWADVMFRPTITENTVSLSPITAIERMNWFAGRRFGQTAVPVGAVEVIATVPKESSGARSQRAEIAQKLMRFWSPFLTHCAIPQPEDNGAPVHMSLGTVTDPGTWQQAPDSRGRVSVLIPDANRHGARRAFAVRPTGRYDDWTRASDWHMTSDGANVVAFQAASAQRLFRALGPDPAQQQFAHTTLPRTEPLEKPVILSARRIVESEGLYGRGVFEVAVAHPSDMVLAAANRANAALLAPQELSVGLWRDYAHLHWVTALHHILEDEGQNVENWSPKAPFGYGATAMPDDPDAVPKPRDAIEAQMMELRRVVPDAWRGTSVFKFSRLPYFFRTHVLAHVAAGIVVSDHAATRFEEGFPVLSLPWGSEDGYRHRAPTPVPTWEVAIGDGGRHLLLNLTLTRIIDAMPRRDAELWFGESDAQAEIGFKAIKPFVHLPEPLTSYRITLETLAGEPGSAEALRRTQARTAEIDIRPINLTASPNTTSPLYIAEGSGANLKLVLEGDETSKPLTPKTTDGHVWTLPVVLELSDITPLSLELNDAQIEALKGLTDYDTETSAFGFGFTANLAFGDERPANQTEWDQRLEDLVTKLQAADMPALANELSALYESFDPNPQNKLFFQLPAEFWKGDVPDAATAFFGVEIDPDTPWLAMRLPPTNDEINALIQQAGGFEDKQAFLDKITDHLFGPRRRLALQALRGTIPPISGLIRHALSEGEQL